MTAAKFHRITTTGDAAGNVLTSIELQKPPVDVTADPQFLGDPPVMRGHACSWCGLSEHELDGVWGVTARAAHRFDRSPAGGYYSDELLEHQR